MVAETAEGMVAEAAVVLAPALRAPVAAATAQGTVAMVAEPAVVQAPVVPVWVVAPAVPPAGLAGLQRAGMAAERAAQPARSARARSEPQPIL
jgi:hypothetical protein